MFSDYPNIVETKIYENKLWEIISRIIFLNSEIIDKIHITDI